MHHPRPRSWFPISRGRRSKALLGRVLALVILIAAAPGSAQPPAPPASTSASNDLFFVELSGRSSAAAWRKAGGRRQPGGGMIRALATVAARRQAAANRAEQANVRASLAALGAVEQYSLHRLLNGIVVRFDPARLDQLARLPGVTRIVPVDTAYPANSSAIPWTRVEQAWRSPLGLHGDGIRIGIIDTGIDYQHSHFGGTGLEADYLANDRTVISEGGAAAFPTAKVVGGWDFVGDGYNGNNTPQPDPDPTDCHGHGTHVAGIAAGFGVNFDGTTYSGPYDETLPFDTMRIGPGVAPHALLYSLRVFGCTGGSNFVPAALDWAMDPNGDDDLSDHLDVVNLSIGSPFATAAHINGIAADEAVAAGIVVVCSAGNSGDTYFIASAPSTGERAISVASSADPGSYPQGVVRVHSPPSVTGDKTASRAAFAPDPLGQYGQVVLVDDGAGVSNTDGCEAILNDVAGKIAMIDRGNCTFVVKATNAQTARATGVVIVNNVAGGVPTLNGASSEIVIPVLGISLADGNALKTAMGSATVMASMLLVGGGQEDTIAPSSSRGTRAGPFPPLLKPDVSAPGVDIVSAASGMVSGGTLSGNRAIMLGGTSMSSPHVAGLMALLRERNPSWTVAELKAAVMNHAIHDVSRFPGGVVPLGAGRAGAGRVDAKLAAEAEVIAFDADNPDAVSIAINLVPTEPTVQIRTVRVVNKGISERTYEVAIETKVDAPGIAFSLPDGPSAIVPALGTIDLTVHATAIPAQMKHAQEAGLSVQQNGQIRHWLTEESAFLTFRQGGMLRFRLPLLAAGRPASTMTGGAVITGGAASGSTTISLNGTEICTGALGAGPVCTGAFPTDVVSLVTPFELQVSSPRDPGIEATFDLRHVGVAYDPTLDRVMFGVSTWGDWSTPTDIRFNIEVDPDEDGTWDRLLINTNGGFFASTHGTDVFLSSVAPVDVTLPLNGARPENLDTAPFLNRTLLLCASPAALGLTGGDTNFRYRVRTFRGLGDGTPFDVAGGPYAWDLAAQGLDFGGAHLVQALDGASIPVTWNEANLAANGSLGALLLFHHNAGESSSQEIPLWVPVGLGGFAID